MAHEPVDLKEADAVEITTVLDNTCDMLLAGNKTVRRPSLGEKVGRKVLVVCNALKLIHFAF